MYKDSVAIIRPLRMVLRLKGIQAGDRILYADRTKLFGRKLPSDSLFSKLKENRVLWWNLLSIENQLIKKSKSK
jgi:carboxyl-terminal processing protease